MGQQGLLLHGKCALITGASKGIGSAIAEAFAREGAELVLVGRSEDSLQEVAEECRDAGAASVECAPTNMLDAASVDELARRYESRVDILVNNAGMSTGSNLKDSVMEGDPDQWQEMMTLNLISPMRLMRRLAPAMAKREGGATIINMSSVAGLEASKGNPAYAASKWGMSGWSESAYQELQQHNIRVVAIYPHYVQSKMTDNAAVDSERLIRPNDIAEAALLPFRVSKHACPVKIVVENAVPVK